MITLSAAHAATRLICATICCIVMRPWKKPEAVRAVLGAAPLVFSSLVPAAGALAAILKGTDVYLFLIGMMVLAEFARRERLFDWLAEHAVRHWLVALRREGVEVSALKFLAVGSVVMPPALLASLASDTWLAPG